MKRSIVVAFLAAHAGLAAPVRGHEYWLAPTTYRAAPGDTVRVTAYVGTGFRGELKPYASPRVVKWMARDRAVTDLRTTSIHGDDVFGRWVAVDGGGGLIAYESNFVTIDLPAAEFDRYLELEGLDGPRAERARSGAAATPGRERYARCPKVWIAGRDARRVTQPAGLTIELVPTSDPALPGPLQLQLLYRGAPLAGTLVRAWNHRLSRTWRPSDAARRDSVGPAHEARTDARGRVRLPLRKDGEWLVSAVHMVPSADPRNTDWESYWASLTFARRTLRR